VSNVSVLQWQGFEGLAYDSRSKPCIPTPVRERREIVDPVDG
jgi:hypothetical protein